jgi:hypothetical protein
MRFDTMSVATTLRIGAIELARVDPPQFYNDASLRSAEILDSDVPAVPVKRPRPKAQFPLLLAYSVG